MQSLCPGKGQRSHKAKKIPAWVGSAVLSSSAVRGEGGEVRPQGRNSSRGIQGPRKGKAVGT